MSMCRFYLIIRYVLSESYGAWAAFGYLVDWWPGYF